LKEGANGGTWSPSTMGKLLARIELVMLVLVLTGCGLVELGSPEEDAGGSGTSQVSGPNEVSEALAELEVAQPDSMNSYSRERFRHWSKASDFGWEPPQSSCDAREAALIRDGEDVEVGSDCKVTSGSWYDLYTTQSFDDPQEIDIDHIVPLANAWRSGASSWSDEQRERYANDPDVLLSVEDNANQSKGDKGPEAWKPPNEAVWCDYATRWVGIKDQYDLRVNPEEKEELERMLAACEEG
jgi:hypothetical protein